MNKRIAVGLGLLTGALSLYLFTKKAEVSCTEGETKCEGGDLYACISGQWELVETNSPQCPQPPECEEGDTKCVDTDLYTCVGGEWQLTESDSPSCKVGPPPPLPEGFEIDKITAEPSVVVLGNPVSIKVTWVCPNPGLIERTFSLQCMINGTTLQHTWTINASNGSITFEYTPTSVGTYTATIPGDGIKFNCPSSVSFEVREEEPGVYYCPFGSYIEYESIDALAAHVGSQHHSSKPAIGAGKYYEYIPCPYCGKEFRICTRSAGLSCTSGQRIGAAYALIDHIQSSHPNNPLTIPRCHIEVIVPEPPVTEININTRDAVTYFADFDRETGYRGYIRWHVLGWKYVCVGFMPTICHMEYQRTTTFVSSLGTHHVIIKGPIACRAMMGAGLGNVQVPGGYYTVNDAPTAFDQDVTLANLGDKAVFNVETGEASIVRWE